MKQLLQQINPLARKVGLYTSYELDPKELIGTARAADIEAKFREMGYENPPTMFGIPLSAAKTHPDNQTVHDLSLRKVDLLRPRWQWHIHVWDRVTEFEVYSHYEMRPDMRLLDGESLTDCRNRLQTHFSPSWDTDEYLRGVASSRVQSFTSQ